MRHLLIFLLFINSQSLFANTKSVKILRDKLVNQSNEITKIAAQIKDIDNKISVNNVNYVDRMKEIESLERNIEELKTDLSKSAEAISKEYKYTRLALDHYLLEATDTEDEDNFYSKKIYMEVLAKKLKGLKQAQKNSNGLLSSLQDIENSLTKKKQDEEEIYKLIVELESSKKEYSETYISLMENKNLVQGKLDKLLAKKTAIKKVYAKRSGKNSKILFTMGLPIQSFVKADSKNKGISFRYNETSPIKAPRSGKVVYAGELASYGKVLIIDHGSDVRSVLLGDIATKVAKGDLVEHNQVVGYTMVEPGNIKTLYYEVRKKNVAQNTLQWVAKKEKEILKI